MVLTPSRYLNQLQSYTFLNIDMSKSLQTLTHDDVHRHDSSKVVKGSLSVNSKRGFHNSVLYSLDSRDIINKSLVLVKNFICSKVSKQFYHHDLQLDYSYLANKIQCYNKEC